MPQNSPIVAATPEDAAWVFVLALLRFTFFNSAEKVEHWYTPYTFKGWILNSIPVKARAINSSTASISWRHAIYG
jgi:hypothetical protein